MTTGDPAPPGDSAATDTGGFSLGGRYVAERLLARGGMASVYLGRDGLLDRPVAIKVFAGDADPRDRDAFLREARAVAQLSHPNIVDVYDTGVEGAMRYIVMQYVPGESLREALSRQSPMEPRWATALAIRLAEALHYAHQRGIVHCDMKPGNVLLGDHGQPKIVDFGIARGAASGGDLREMIAGTAGYIAPEQLSGAKIDGRTDIYSLAAVLYELLCGRPPHGGASLADLAAEQQRRPPTPVDECNPFVPSALAAVVMEALDPDPARRFPTARAFAEALRDAQEDGREADTVRIAPAVARTTASEGRRPADAPTLVQPVAPVAPAVAMRRRTPWLFLTLAALLAVLFVALATLLVVTLLDRRADTTVTVPLTTGRRIDEAARQIRAAGLRVGEVSLRTDNAPLGTVIGQSPADGTLREGDYVNLSVSLGGSR